MNLPPGRALEAALSVADRDAHATIEADEPMLRTPVRLGGLRYLPAGQALRAAATGRHPRWF
jgi:hypothetical protein